jgi:hypothetical protein
MRLLSWSHNPLSQLRETHVANLRLQSAGEQHASRLKSTVLHLQATLRTLCCSRGYAVPQDIANGATQLAALQ